jgi:hypothetical protein
MADLSVGRAELAVVGSVDRSIRRWSVLAPEALLEVGMAGGRVGDFHVHHVKKWYAHGEQAGSEG